MNRRLALVAATAALLAAAPLSAQSPLSQVLDLNRQAMTAYQNLELEQAMSLLEQAVQVAQRNRVTGAPLARTYLNMGVVAVGGFGDNGRGLQYFVQALRADPNIQLDPLTSTPEIQTVFALARQQAGSGGSAGGGDAGGGGAEGGGGGGGGASQGGGGTLPHEPVPEQLAQTAVPVYIEVPGNVAHVYLYYRGHGMREFRRVEMQRVQRGYGYEIPCSDVFEPAVEYYIVAFATDGSPLGFAGTQSAPVRVPIVARRTQPAPALPGRAPPEQCVEAECPPGMEGCHSRRGGGAAGSTCSSDGDCGSGLVCRDDMCVADDDGGDGGYLPHFFFRASVGLALGYVTSGMQADGFPPTQELLDAAQRGDPSSVWVLTTGDSGVCPLGDPAVVEAYCVRVAQPGFVPNMAIRLAVGTYIPDPSLAWLGFAGFVRFAPISGQGDLSFVLLGARVQVRPLLDLERSSRDGSGPTLSLHLGFSVGQVQHQPPGNEPADGSPAPWIISGLNGIPVGVNFGYRFMKHVGVYAEAEAMFQFPTFMFNADISAGLEVGF